MLTDKEVKRLQEELATAKNPLIFYDDDPDGVCSFVLLYNIHREGKGIIVKSSPNLSDKFLGKVEENNPDKIFVLDLPIIDQEFVDGTKVPIFWVDHHQPLKLNKVNYFNPRIREAEIYIPTTRMIYQLSNRPEDLWLAMVGCIGDYHMPDFEEQFRKKYPELLSKKTTIDKAIYDYPIGKLVRIFAFMLKGNTSDVNKCVKILTRIKSPDEIMQQTTAQGKYIYKKFEKIDLPYQKMLEKAKQTKSDGDLFIYTYADPKWSFTAELAGELLHHNPKKVVIVARKKSGEMKCSFRSRKLPVAPALEKALVGIKGYGGGHELACGVVVKEEDWNQFLDNFRRELDK